MIGTQLMLAGVLLAPAAPGSAELTPDTMAKHGFHVECRFTNHTITEGNKPTRPTGLVLVQATFDAEKGPTIKGIESASLVVRDGETVLLSVPVQASPYPEAKGVRHVQFSIHKDLLPKARLVLDEGGEGRPRTFAVDLKAFGKDK
jgi:hypothetical protein